MNKQTQDLLWASLSKEERKRHRDGYRAEVKVLSYNSGFNDALESIFGHHNLTSDTEPEEMLMVERKKVIEWYSSLSNEHKIYAKGTTDRISLGARLAMIEELFGDKCLPDKPSVQAEPKFKVGDKVRIIIEGWQRDPIFEVIYYDEGDNTYKLDMLDCEEADLWVKEWQIEPYTEPETKENMEEKELDIYELLESNDDVKTIYSVIHDAEVEFKLANRYIEFMGIGYYSNGSMYDVAGRCMLYPSRALYEKYPLDAYSAWMEWKEERKPKYEVRSIIEYWEIGKSYKWTAPYNIIVSTKEEAQQAAEAVRECLDKFHEKKGEP